MDIKPGYKLTEVGIIPKDWEVSTLAECSKRITDGEHITPKRSSSGYYLLSARNILNGRIDLSDVDYVGADEYRRIRQRCNPERGDVLISCSGTVGRVATVPKGLECVMVRSAALVKPDSTRLSGRYAQYFLQSAAGQNQIVASLNQGAQANLFLNHIQSLCIPLPPDRAEQEAIAEALSDADALIKSLEQLIAKKRNLKHGALQELLTGKRRLLGFALARVGYKKTQVGVIPDDWELKLLPDVCRFRGGKAHEQHIAEFGQYVCVNSKFISTDGKVRKYSTANFCCANQNDVLMVMSDLPNGRALAKAYFVEQDDLYAVNQRVCALTAYRDCPRFLFHILNRNTYFLKFDNGVSQTHLLNDVFRACPIPLPPSRAEQEAIAEALSDMDTEIAALEARLAKARQLKQGMMHNLLTGKIRLI
jgi:type I restriction enzyme, S subunit